MTEFHKTLLITAEHAKQTGQFAGKKVRAIDNDRATLGTQFADKPSKLTIEFVDEISTLEVTLENKHYTGVVSAEGLGFDNPNVTPLFSTELGRHTYQFILPQPAQGLITFETQGGAGELLLYDISGFAREEML